MCYVQLKQEDVDAQGRELTAQLWIDIARQARDACMAFALSPSCGRTSLKYTTP